MATHETRIREVPGSNRGADQPDWGFYVVSLIIKAKAGLDFHYHDPFDHYSSNSSIYLSINKTVGGVCLYIDYFCTILGFLSVSYKTMMTRVVLSFDVCLSVCLFVPPSLKNGWLDFNQTWYP